MSVRPLKVLPISYARRHFREVVRRASYEAEHVLLTRHGKPQACLIPMRDTRVLWQLQDRPVAEMEARIKTGYERWLKAKRADEEGWPGMEICDDRWVAFWHFEKM